MPHVITTVRVDHVTAIAILIAVSLLYLFDIASYCGYAPTALAAIMTISLRLPAVG